jgi:hypothetical protein
MRRQYLRGDVPLPARPYAAVPHRACSFLMRDEAPLMGFALRSLAPARERSRAMFPSDRPHMPFPERPLPDVRFFVSG